MGWTTEIASDGRVSATVELQIVVPNVPMIQFTRLRYRRSGTTTWADAQPVFGTGTLLAKIGGLAPGLFYDFEGATVSGPNVSTAATISSVLAPGDVTAPSTPSTPTIQAQHLREFTFATTPGNDADLKDLQWQVRTSSGGAGSLVMEGTAAAIRGAASTIKVTLPASVPYGSTRWLRVRARDFTGNPTDPTAGWSTSASFSATQVATGDFPVTPILPPGTVTTPIRQEVVIQSLTYSVGAGVGSSQGILHTHNLGKVPSGLQAFPNNLAVTITPNSITDNTVNFNVINLTPAGQSGTAAVHFW